MRKAFLLSFAFLILASSAWGQSGPGSTGDYPLNEKGWWLGISNGVPFFTGVQAEKGTNTQMKFYPSVGFGAAASWYWSSAPSTEGKKTISINLPAVFLRQSAEDETSLDVLFGAGVGFLNDTFQLFGMWNTGKLPYDRSRMEIGISIGVQVPVLKDMKAKI